jgi:hypothetical protein
MNAEGDVQRVLVVAGDGHAGHVRGQASKLDGCGIDRGEDDWNAREQLVAARAYEVEGE